MNIGTDLLNILGGIFSSQQSANSAYASTFSQNLGAYQTSPVYQTTAYSPYAQNPQNYSTWYGGLPYYPQYNPYQTLPYYPQTTPQYNPYYQNPYQTMPGYFPQQSVNPWFSFLMSIFQNLGGLGGLGGLNPNTLSIPYELQSLRGMPGSSPQQLVEILRQRGYNYEVVPLAPPTGGSDGLAGVLGGPSFALRRVGDTRMYTYTTDAYGRVASFTQVQASTTTTSDLTLLRSALAVVTGPGDKMNPAPGTLFGVLKAAGYDYLATVPDKFGLVDGPSRYLVRHRTTGEVILATAGGFRPAGSGLGATVAPTTITTSNETLRQTLDGVSSEGARAFLRELGFVEIGFVAQAGRAVFTHNDGRTVSFTENNSGTLVRGISNVTVMGGAGGTGTGALPAELASGISVRAPQTLDSIMLSLGYTKSTREVGPTNPLMLRPTVLQDVYTKNGRSFIANQVSMTASMPPSIGYTFTEITGAGTGTSSIDSQLRIGLGYGAAVTALTRAGYTFVPGESTIDPRAAYFMAPTGTLVFQNGTDKIRLTIRAGFISALPQHISVSGSAVVDLSRSFASTAEVASYLLSLGAVKRTVNVPTGANPGPEIVLPTMDIYNLGGTDYIIEQRQIGTTASMPGSPIYGYFAKVYAPSPWDIPMAPALRGTDTTVSAPAPNNLGPLVATRDPVTGVITIGHSA